MPGYQARETDEAGIVNGDKDARRDADDKALRARLDSLSGALDARRRQDEAQKAQEKASIPGGETGKAMSLGFRVLSEFVAGVVAGGVIGWLLDKWLGTSPLFLLVVGALGTAAGFMNVYRIAAKPTSPPGGGQENGRTK